MAETRRRRPVPRYASEIVVVLVVKSIALFAIWSIWFSGPARKDVDADAVAARIYASPPAAAGEKASHVARP